MLFIIIICYESFGNEIVINKFESNINNNYNYIYFEIKKDGKLLRELIGEIKEKITENLTVENPYLDRSGILTLILAMNNFKLELIEKIHIKM